MPFPGWHDDGPQPWLTNVGAARPIAWHVEGARQFLDTVADSLRGAPRNGRARHLVAVPLVGTGAGGAYHAAGAVIETMLPMLTAAASRHRFDIALVTKELSASAAAQAERRRHRSRPDAWCDLTNAQREKAEDLARRAAAGELVLFLGAGVSAGAGLPGWNELLRELAVEAGMSAEQGKGLERLPTLDRATLIERRLERGGGATGSGRPLGEAVAKRFAAYWCSLSHALLAGLPVRQVVTTNYDQLFEFASEGIGRAVSVLPHAPLREAERWLLKMHGCVTRGDDIVLTREDYLRYELRRAALAGIVQALLITQHILFVGFSLSDDNFHRVTDAVRRAVRGDRVDARPAPLGTALVVERNDLLQELWAPDFEWLTMDAGDGESLPVVARRLEIFLDHLLALAGAGSAHLLDDRYADVLSSGERALRDALHRFIRELPDEARSAVAWHDVQATLRRVGWRE